MGCKALRLRGGWSPPVVRLHAWPLVAPMAAARLSRRELASWAACGAGAALAPRAAHAFAPPVGNVELLLPLLRCRDIVAEQREAFAAVTLTLTLTLTLTAHRSPLTFHSHPHPHPNPNPNPHPNPNPSPHPNPNPNQATAAARASIDWRGLQLVLARPPLTEARRGKAAAVVGSGFGGAAAAYDESLRYLAEIDERCDRR